MPKLLFALVAAAICCAAQPVLIPTMVIAQHSGKCIDVEFESIYDGARIIQYDCENAPYDHFTLKPAGQSFQLIASNSNKCLQVISGSLANNAAVEQRTCAITNGQLWNLQTLNAGYRFRASHSNLCLGVRSGSTANSTRIVQTTCINTPSQEWRFPTAAVPLTLTAKHSNKCAGIEGGSTADNARALQYGCTSGTEQQFSVKPDSGYYRLTANHSGKCLTVQAASQANEADVTQLNCVSVNHQLWSLVQAGVNYQLVARHSNKCATVLNSATAEGARIVQIPCGTATSGLWAISQSGSVTPSSLGLWSSVIQLPLVPVAAANLPNGNLLLWSAHSPYTFGGDNGLTATAIFNPATNASTAQTISNTGHDMFCPGTANLPDGRVLVNGGSSSTKTSIYDPANNTWQAGQPMNIGRGYQGDTLLSTGEVFTLGGSWSGGSGGKTGELWSAASGWRRLDGIPATAITAPDPAGVYRGDNHAWLFTAPNGQIFHAGPSRNMNWFTTTGAGTRVSAGNRGNDAYSMNGNAAMFDIGRILKVGGAPGYDNAVATKNAYIIEINNGAQVTRLPNTTYARVFHSSVVLPSGEVVIIGGQPVAYLFTDIDAVLPAEIFNPATNSFKVLAPMSVPRTYHSVAILLPNGKIFVGGGGLCGVGCSENHPDAQIFTPPYLLNSNGTPRTQPVIGTAPAQAGWGTTVNVTTNSAVTRFALVRLSSITHTVNNDQRRIPLTFTSAAANSYQLAIPSNRGVVLPGYYYLFAMDATGTPSVARTILIQ